MDDAKADGRILTSRDQIAELIRRTRRIAVLGIKTEAQANQPAFYVPEYLAEHRFDIVPVPVYFPEATEILGRKVHRTVASVSGPVDLVLVFRRPSDIPGHVPDILAARPRAVWFQQGIRNDEAARQLAAAGIDVVQDRCLMVDHRHLA